ncbi:MAG: carboxypeptidase regulatory-like domain-containing protein [Nitriliruptoraceae bacterium]
MTGMPRRTASGLVRIDLDVHEVVLVDGRTAVVRVEVTNLDTVIRSYRLEVLGLDPAYAQVPVHTIDLFPEERRPAEITLTLPEDFPAGRRRVGIAVTQHDDPLVSATAALDLVLPAHPGLQQQVEPATLTVGRSGTFVLTPVNTGNTVLDLRFRGQEPERKVEVRFDPPRARVLPGEQVQVQATASGPRPWFGAPLVRTLELTTSAGEVSAVSTAMLLLKPRIGRRAVALLGLLAVVTLFALVILWSFDNVAERAEANERLLRQGLGEEDALGIRAASPAVSGSVSSATGAPIDGAVIELFDPGSPTLARSTAVTTASGAFRLANVPPGEYLLRVQAAGFSRVWYPSAAQVDGAETVTIRAGEDLGGLDVVLAGLPGSVTGQVVGADVAGAQVTARLPASAFEGSALDPIAADVVTVEVDDTGEFLLPELATPATYEVVVRKEGFATQTATVNLAPGEQREDLRFVLRRGDGRLAGQVVGSDGEPVPNALVEVTDGTTELVTRTLSGEADAGTFEVRDLPTPSTYTLAVSAEGFGTESLTVQLEASQQRDDVTVVLSGALGELGGRVTTADGTPLGGVDVTVEGAEVTRSTVSLSTGEVGRWLARDLPAPGEYTVIFEAEGYVPQAASIALPGGVEASQLDVDAALVRATGSVAGRVVDVDGQPIGGVEIVLEGDEAERQTLSSDLPPGAYGFDDLPPGAYTLTYRRAGSSAQTLLVDLEAGQRLDLDDVELEDQARLTGTVRIDGVGRSGLGVRVYTLEGYPDEEVAATVTEAGGTFEIVGLDGPRDYIVEFEVPDGGEVVESRTVFLEAGATVDLEVDR